MEVLKIRLDKDSPWIEIPAIVGPPGPKGEDYILTDEDKEQIAKMVIDIIPSGEGVEY